MSDPERTVYEEGEDYVLGERPVGVPGEVVFHRVLTEPHDDSIIAELEREGSEAGRVARAQHALGKAVAATRAGADGIKLYIHEHPDVIVGAATVIATSVAGGIVFEKVIKPEMQKRRQDRTPQGY